MKPTRTVGVCLLFFTSLSDIAFAQAQARKDEIRLVEVENEIFASSDGTSWFPTIKGAVLKPHDHLRVGPGSRAALQWSDNAVVTLAARTEIEILPAHAAEALSGLHIFKGLLSFFHRDKPGRIRVIMSGAVAGINGTEFVAQVATVDNIEQAILSVLDGTVTFSNNVDGLTLTNGEQAIAVPGSPPRRTPGFIANNLLQWAFYYPAVLDPRDLELTPAEEQRLQESLAAYRRGDLLDALKKYGAAQPATDAERLYRAALLLSVGEVDPVEADLEALARGPGRTARLAAALQQLIAAVKWQRLPESPRELSTELLAASYYEQSRAAGDPSLKSALALARRSATNSPAFGFSFARVAELEFSFGRIGASLTALDQALAASPSNAQALALKGYLLAAENKPRQGIEWFDRALAIDPGLGNARLGRGLCRIRRGDRAGGREDLLIAAALEPRRAHLRSYLGKAYGDAGETRLSLHELDLAKHLDTNDPTAWLYSALVKADQNRINEAIADLEKSQELNDNRSVYRSSVLLDQDRAVRSANLARWYADADLNDVAVREAGRAVSSDYANYSAHLFLANSYELERRASLSNHRFESSSFAEYLLANLLGPANGQILAQSVSQLEFSQLLDRNRAGLIANTEYFGRGAWHHSSAQYGTYNGSSYSLEAEYRSEPAERVNQDYEIRQLEAKFKHDLTPQDSIYLHVIDYRAEGGDTAQRFSEAEIARKYRFDDVQTPTVFLGYHHEWSPQNHTLLLLGRQDDIFKSGNPASFVLALDRGFGTTNGLAPVQGGETYRSRAQVYTAEAQQIARIGPDSVVAGARLQWTEQSAFDRFEDPTGPFYVLVGIKNPVSIQREEVWSSSSSVYVYNYLQIIDSLEIVGGLNFTHQSLPVNTATAPLASDRDHQERLSPKAGLIWSPAPWTSVRASYSRSLTGQGLGQSVRLEPTHVAGLVQTYRDPIPFSIIGDSSGADLETAEVLWEGRFQKTYVSVGGQRLFGERNRDLGLYLSDENYDPPPALGLIHEKIRFEESALDASFHQLFSDEWSIGVSYRFGYAELKREFPQYPRLGVGGVQDRTDWEGWLHNLSVSALYRHRSGIFARAEALLFAQERDRQDRTLPADDFWQVNVFAGYRFPRQRAEIAVGVLNLIGDDYRLDPINHYSDQPRARTFYARLLLNF